MEVLRWEKPSEDFFELGVICQQGSGGSQGYCPVLAVANRVEQKVTCIFLFQSVHQVMKAEKVLKDRGIPTDVIPVPREISSDCGVAIQVPWEFTGQALCFMGEAGLSCVECYRRGEGGQFEKGI